MDDNSNEKSEYEQRRARNIVRNNARLRELGLISRGEEERSNAIAWGEQPIPNPEEESTTTKGKSGTKRKRNIKDISEEPSRKSLRLQGKKAAVAATKPEESPEEREERVRECREVRLRAANAVAKAGAQKAAKENPTATYEHCLMRVRTMSDKALANRVKAIETRVGKHCVVKMAVFKSCLQDEGKWDLADLASEALERLKALQPPPEK